MVDLQLTALAAVTGLVTGSIFKFLDVPIPAPPELPGVMGIIGIYVGFKAVQSLGITYHDALGALGLA